MNKAKKYKLKLDYTAEELKELKRLSKDYNSAMNAVWGVVGAEYSSSPVGDLQKKYRMLDNHKDFDFMADINNVVMGTAIFPEKKYVVHDKVTGQYIYYSMEQFGLRWGQLDVVIPYEKTKEGWLAINPAYEPMLEKVEY